MSNGRLRTAGNGDVPESLLSQDQWEKLSEHLALSPRQRDVCHSLLRGLSDSQIADELGIAKSTVRTHLQLLYSRLSVQDRVELILTLVREHMRINGDAQKHPRA